MDLEFRGRGNAYRSFEWVFLIHKGMQRIAVGFGLLLSLVYQLLTSLNLMGWKGK